MEQSLTYQGLDIIDFPKLLLLLQQYKEAVGESELSETQSEKLKSAIMHRKIEYFVAKHGNELVAMCSICEVFSTYLCEKSGIFEDFFIVAKYRHTGIARELTHYVFDEMCSRGIATVWVGCAESDIEMYKSLGFETPLGNLLTWSSRG